jgi:PhnB protein
MKAVNPYLNFPGNAEEAFNFYGKVFGTEVRAVRYRDFGDNGMGAPESELDKMAHVSIALGSGNVLMATDVIEGFPATLQQGNNFYIAIEADDAEEAGRLFDALAAGGTVEMALARTEWAESYGSLRDRFGIGWMVSYTGNVTWGDGQ